MRCPVMNWRKSALPAGGFSGGGRDWLGRSAVEVIKNVAEGACLVVRHREMVDLPMNGNGAGNPDAGHIEWETKWPRRPSRPRAPPETAARARRSPETAPPLSRAGRARPGRLGTCGTR